MHYYQHNIKDFRSGVINFTRQERWLYRDLLDVYYDTEKPLPLELVDVCDAIGAQDDEQLIVAKILRIKFIKSLTGWVHERCEAELANYRLKADTARTNGKNGGRPPKNNPRKTQQVSDGLPSGSYQDASGGLSESGSKANQEPITNNHKPVTKQDRGAPPVGDADLFPGVDPQVVADFKALRKQKRAAVTKTAMDKIAREAEKAGLSLEAALRVCCSRGWQGFEAEWVQPDRRQGGQGSASSEKFKVAHLDHTSSNAAMAASMKRHGITIPDGDIDF